MKLRTMLFLAGLLIALSACMNTKASGKLAVGPLPELWEKKPYEGAYLFFEHRRQDATIHLDLQCEDISESPLPALLAQLLSGMGKYQIISQQNLMIAEREGLVSEVNVKVDGVDRYLKTMVLRKNRCIFDAVLSAPRYQADLVKDFDNLLKTFTAEAPL